MKQNKWKSNEANDKSLTGAKSAVLREKRKTQTLLLLSQSGRWLCAVVNIYWLIMSPSYHCIFMASDVDIKKYYTTTPHSSPALLTVRSSSLYDLRQINKIILLSGQLPGGLHLAGLQPGVCLAVRAAGPQTDDGGRGPPGHGWSSLCRPLH